MIPTRVGQKAEGGYFTGVIRVGNSAYAIIVSPKHTEVKKVRFKTRPTKTQGTRFVNDGWANAKPIE